MTNSLSLASIISNLRDALPISTWADRISVVTTIRFVLHGCRNGLSEEDEIGLLHVVDAVLQEAVGTIWDDERPVVRSFR